MKDSDHGAMSTDDWANDAAFGTSVGPDRADFYQHAIAVHRRAHGRRRNENVSGELRLEACVERGGVRGDKPVAVAMHAQLSNQNVFACNGFGNREAVRIDLNELTTAHQAVQAVGEFEPGGTVESQFPHQLLESSGAFGLAFDLLKDDGIGESVQNRGCLYG